MAIIGLGGVIAGVKPDRSKKVTLTSAQVLALHMTPIEVIAAPGRGKAVVLRGIEARLDYNSAAYGGIAGTEDLEFRYTDATGTEILDVETTGFLDQTTDQTRWTPADASAVTPVENAPIVVRLAGAITTGNSPLILDIYYLVVPIHTEKVADVTIATAEVLDLHSTPKEIVAAQGAGKAVKPVGVKVTLDYNSAAYVGIAAGEDLEFRYTDSDGGLWFTIETTGFLDQTADQTVADVTPEDVDLVANAPIVAVLGGAVLTGDSPLVVEFRYEVENV